MNPDFLIYLFAAIILGTGIGLFSSNLVLFLKGRQELTTIIAAMTHQQTIRLAVKNAQIQQPDLEI